MASGSFQYDTGDASGVKVASRDLTGATTTLALVAKAGTRYQNLPGFTDGLEKFAFKVNLDCRNCIPSTRPLYVEHRLTGGICSCRVLTSVRRFASTAR